MPRFVEKLKNPTHYYFWFFKLTSRHAWLHEVFCTQCRVTWKSWLQRVRGDQRGYNPRG